jgi:hypothetical protein
VPTSLSAFCDTDFPFLLPSTIVCIRTSGKSIYLEKTEKVCAS